jgi:hypothetical protein
MGSLLLTFLPLVLFAQTPVLVESFSTSAFPPAGWDTTRSDTTMSYWIRYQTSGADPDSHHARVLTYKTTDTLRQGFSELVTLAFDLETAVGVESLSFWYRFSVGSQNIGPDDTISVAIRDDSSGWCGLWKLGTAGQSNTWAIARISLVPFNGYRGARLRFRFDDRPNAGQGSSNRYFWLDSIKVISYAVGIVDDEPVRAGRPDHVIISICPNPARRRVEICFNAGKEQRAPLRGSGASFQDFQTKSLALKIYDIFGRLVKCFYYALSPNPSALVWDGTDQSGRAVPAGVYFCETVVDGVKEHQSLILTR